MLKTCTKCKEDLGLGLFHKDASKPDGLNACCKECHNAAFLARRLRDKEGYNKKRREYYSKNKHVYLSNVARRRAYLLNATPAWLSDKHKRDINTIYKVCAKVSERTGKQHHVDHIVPLKGKSVCGLHVPWNLSIIPAPMNLQKGNTHG